MGEQYCVLSRFVYCGDNLMEWRTKATDRPRQTITAVPNSHTLLQRLRWFYCINLAGLRLYYNDLDWICTVSAEWRPSKYRNNNGNNNNSFNELSSSRVSIHRHTDWLTEWVGGWVVDWVVDWSRLQRWRDGLHQLSISRPIMAHFYDDHTITLL